LHNDWTLLQTDAEKFENFMPNFDGAIGDGYKRAMPDRFTEERDDRLMNSMIQSYALEMKDDSGNPSGHFFFDRDAARSASQEVVSTNYKWSAGQTEAWLKDNFDNTWTHFDVNSDNLIEVERMPQFFRYLMGNSLEIGLQ